MRHPKASKERDHKTVSDSLLDLAERLGKRRVTVGDLACALGDRAYGALLLLFAFPVLIPNPIPGLTSVLGIPLTIISIQMIFAIPQPRLPRFITQRSVNGGDFQKMLELAVPWLRKAERVLRPRLPFLTSKFAERLIASACFFLSCILMLPIPFSNFIPATAICFIALGLFERDGIFILAGVVGGIGAVALLWKVILIFVMGLIHMISVRL